MTNCLPLHPPRLVPGCRVPGLRSGDGGGRVDGNRRSQDLTHLRDGSKDTASSRIPGLRLLHPGWAGPDGSARDQQGWGHTGVGRDHGGAIPQSARSRRHFVRGRGARRPPWTQREAQTPGPAGGRQADGSETGLASWPPLGSLHGLYCPANTSSRAPTQHREAGGRVYGQRHSRPPGQRPGCLCDSRSWESQAGSRHQPGQLRCWDRRAEQGQLLPPERRCLGPGGPPERPHSHRESPREATCPRSQYRRRSTAGTHLSSPHPSLFPKHHATAQNAFTLRL